MTLITCTNPARTGCRFKYTENGHVFWVSNPKRGGLRAWARIAPKQVAPGCYVERWIPCSLAEVVAEGARFYAHDERHPRFARLCADYLDFVKRNPGFAS